MVDYSKEPVKGEPAAHTAARKLAIKQAADKAAQIKRNVPSNSAAHDKAINEARKEVASGLELMRKGDRAIGLGQQSIAHALITLDTEEAFPNRAKFATWFAHSPEQARSLVNEMTLFVIGDPPAKPPKDETSQHYANLVAQYRAKKTAIGRACELAAAVAIVGKNVSKKTPAPSYDPKRGWTVPVSALCMKDQTAFDPSHMALLDGTARLVRGKSAQGGETLVTLRASVDQIVKAVKSRHKKAAPANERGANENSAARDGKAIVTLQTAVVAADPQPLLTFWHELTRIYREGSLVTLDKNVVATLQRLHVEVGAFLTERTRAVAAVNALPTTEAGKSALVKGAAAKAEEAKASA